MKAKFDGIYSIDLPGGPPELPSDPSNCWVVIQADIGHEGGEGADIFTFYVCTISALEDQLKVKGCELGRHLIILERFDWELVEKAICDICANASGETWEDIAHFIARYGSWEYEDYNLGLNPIF